MNAAEYKQVEKLAVEIAESATLPDSLSEVVRAGLDATRPSPAIYEAMIDVEVEPRWWDEPGAPIGDVGEFLDDADAFRPWPGPVYVVELEAELAASEESRAAARAGIEELRYERSKCWSKLLDATRVSLLDPDSAEARADVARALGRLARMERATAEVACVFQLHAERIERFRRGRR